MKFLFLVLLLAPHIAFADGFPKAPEKDFYGFAVEGRIINPKCIELLQPWASEAADTSAIITSINLENCQDSEIAATGQSFTIGDDKSVSFLGDPDDAHSYFSYKVLGITDKNIFALFHGGTIGIYKIVEIKEDHDFLAQTSRTGHVLTKLGQSFVPCFISGKVQGNKLTIKKNHFNPDGSTAEQCSEPLETIEYEF